MSSHPEVHPSGWFTYRSKQYVPAQKQTNYSDCRLLCDIPGPRGPCVTFHQEEQCRRGMLIHMISQPDGTRQLCGWKTQLAFEDTVLDTTY